MIKKIFLVYSLSACQLFFAQQRPLSVILYDKGNAAISRKDYRTADSLFTLSLNLEPHPDSYYNRAVCRRQLQDFKGYCLDLLSAIEYGDRESKGLYWKQCATADTIYKKNNGEFATKSDYESVEYVKSYKYNTNFEYEKCDTAGAPIIAKIRKNNEIIYRNCREVNAAKYIGGVDSLIYFLKTQTDVLGQVKKNNLAGAVFISVIIDESGKIKELKNTGGQTDEAVTELLKGLMNTPNWKPADYGDKNVRFQAYLAICYYGNELLVSSNSFLNKDSAIIEVMPEFPGGVMAMMRHIQKNITYPQKAKEAGLSGKCFLKFVVLPNGKLTNLEVLKGIPGCSECDREAIRAILSMPAWKPGTQNGKPVPVFFNLPINFQLK